MARSLHKNSFILLFTFIFLLCSTNVVFAADTHSVIVNENARIDVQITDQSGRTVAPGKPIDTVSYIVKSKPEEAKVNVHTADDSELESSGKLTMAFSCDTPGTIELQTFIRVKEGNKYYTGTHIINVVEEKSENSKIVIMSIGSNQIIDDDAVVKTDAAPVIHNDRTYVPLRVLSDIFGAQCNYEQEKQQVTVTQGDNTITMIIGENSYTLNGTSATLNAPAYIIDGRTMVPVRFFAEAFGIVVKPTYSENGAVADIMFQVK